MQHTLCPKCYNSVGLDLDTCPYCGLDIRELRTTADMNYDLYKNAIDEGIADAKKGDFGLLRQIACGLTFETVSLSPVRLDPKLGISLYKKLDELGDVDAEYWIGRAYFKGVYFEKDVNKALDCLNNAAMNDSTLALRGLGDIYAESDPAKAFKMYQAGAKRGDAPCAHKLALFYVRGEQCKQDIDHALELLSVPDSQNNDDVDEHSSVKAADYLFRKNDFENAAKILNYVQKTYDLLEDGYILLGKIYQNEKYSHHDREKAKELFEEAYDIFNSAGAANCLGLLLVSGKESREWFQKAADLGLKVAYYNLACQELFGYNKTYDIEKAKKWLDMAGDGFNDQQHVRLLTLFDSQKGIDELIETIPNFIKEYEKILHLDEDYAYPSADEAYVDIMETIEEITEEYAKDEESEEEHKEEFDILISYCLLKISIAKHHSISDEQLEFIRSLIKYDADVTDYVNSVSKDSNEPICMDDLQTESRYSWDNCNHILGTWNEGLYTAKAAPFSKMLFEAVINGLLSEMTFQYADRFFIDIEGIFREFYEYSSLDLDEYLECMRGLVIFRCLFLGYLNSQKIYRLKNTLFYATLES